MRMPVARPRDAHFPEDGQLDRAFGDVYAQILTRADILAIIDELDLRGADGAAGADGADGHEFVDRGDPAAVDWDEGDLTINGAWHDLDLSAIVPDGAVLVLLRVVVVTADNGAISFRENGNANAINVATLSSHVPVMSPPHEQYSADLLVAPSPNRIIEYKATAGWTVDSIDITVGGWWI